MQLRALALNQSTLTQERVDTGSGVPFLEMALLAGLALDSCPLVMVWPKCLYRSRYDSLTLPEGLPSECFPS